MTTTQTTNLLVAWNKKWTTTFAVGSKEIKYYKVHGSVLEDHVRMDETEYFHLLSRNNDFSNHYDTYIKCMEWNPEIAELIALGLSDGRCVLHHSKKQSTVKELVPKYPRSCNALAWNPNQPGWLATGVEKTRSDYNCIFIWDINENSSTSGSSSTNEVHSKFNPSDLTPLSTNNDYFSPNSTVESSNSSTNNTTIFTKISSTQKQSVETISKPLIEIPNNETITSMAWFPEQQNIILVGTQSKFVRVYDVRDSTALKTGKSQKYVQAHNKPVMGIVFDPFQTKHFATFSDDAVVKIWDYRNLVEPIKSITATSKTAQNQSIAQVMFSPTQPNILACLSKNSKTLKLWDLSEERSNRSMCYKTSNFKAVHSIEPIQSFALHPTQSNLFLVSTGTHVNLASTIEPPKFTMSSTSKIVCNFFREELKEDWITSFETSSHEKIDERNESVTADQKKSFATPLQTSSPNFNTPRPKHVFWDTSDLIRERAKASMGLDISRNIEVSQQFQDETLRVLWFWILHVQKWAEKHSNDHLLGIITILNFGQRKNATTSSQQTQQQQAASQSSSSLVPKKPNLQKDSQLNHSLPSIMSIQTLDLIDPSYQDTEEPLKSYSSPQRHAVLSLCGWSKDQVTNLQPNEWNERMAALAIFNYELKTAAKILATLDNSQDLSTQKNNYKFLAFALAGYSEQTKSEFFEIFQTLYPKLDNAYLRASFGFLCRNYSAILDDNEISILDKIGFACLYLSNEKLEVYLTKLKEIYTRTSSILSIVLVGLSSKEGIDAIQRYVDRTGDVQTASILGRLVVPKKFKDQRVERWVTWYCDLLDQWKMWEERSLFESHMISNNPELLKSPEITIRCTFCNQSLVQGAVNQRGRGGRGLTSFQKGNPLGSNTPSGSTANRIKTTSCPGCKKPLPKCSICLMYFGTVAASMGEEYAEALANPEHTALNYSFAWCTMCKHGGHVLHYMEWFERHDECPVSGCSCKCNV